MGDHSSGTVLADGLKQPTRAVGPSQTLRNRNPARRPYSVLLPVGFTVPPAVAGDAVRSYRTLSPFTGPKPA